MVQEVAIQNLDLPMYPMQRAVVSLDVMYNKWHDTGDEVGCDGERADNNVALTPPPDSPEVDMVRGGGGSWSTRTLLR